MAKHQENYGIKRDSDYDKAAIQELIEVKNIKTVREALEIAGLSTSKRLYKGDELIDSGFINIRKLFDQGWTKKQILEDYLGVKATSGGSTNSQNEKNVDDLSAIESALEEGALEVGEVLAETAAAYLVERFPELLIQKLGKRVGSGGIRAAFAKARQQTQARQLGPAAEASRQQEMLNNFDFPQSRRALKSASPPEEDERLNNTDDPWSNYRLEGIEPQHAQQSSEVDEDETSL